MGPASAVGAMASGSDSWLGQPSNRLYVEDLRAKVELIVFLGAGPTCGSARMCARFDGGRRRCRWTPG